MLNQRAVQKWGTVPNQRAMQNQRVVRNQGTIQTWELGWTVPNKRAVQSQGIVQSWETVYKNFCRLHSFSFFLTALACVCLLPRKDHIVLGGSFQILFHIYI